MRNCELCVDSSKARIFLSLFNYNGIHPNLFHEHAGKTRITVSRETLDNWLKSQQGLAAALSLEVPTLLKLINRELLDS